MRRTRHPALLVEMRLGKTLLCIRWMLSLPGKSRRFLVVAPVTVLEAWERELWLEGQRFYATYNLTPKQRDYVIKRALSDPGDTFLLMSYEGLLALGQSYTSRGKRKRRPPILAFWEWDAVALDESTKIRNPSAQITQVCIKGFRQAKHRTILTGLVNPEKILDVVCQFLFLRGHFLGQSNYWEIRNRYFIRAGYEWVPRKGTRDLFRRMTHAIAFVKTVDDCNLPNNITRDCRYLDMNPTQKRMYRQVVREFACDCKDGIRIETKWVITQRLWLARIAGGFDPRENLISTGKADEIIELLNGELAGKKLVVWFRFRAELNYVKSRLDKAGISAATLVGKEPMLLRKSKMKAFREKTRVLLGMESCAKFGSDYSASTVAVYYSNEYSNEARTQSERRIIKYEKSRNHLILDLVTRRSVDVNAVEALKDKSIESRMFLMRLDEGIDEWRA